jgi:hypothetical protein
MPSVWHEWTGKPTLAIPGKIVEIYHLSKATVNDPQSSLTLEFGCGVTLFPEGLDVG